jgi:hypothetical protein
VDESGCCMIEALFFNLHGRNGGKTQTSSVIITGVLHEQEHLLGGKRFQMTLQINTDLKQTS